MPLLIIKVYIYMVDIAIGIPKAELGIAFKEHRVSYNAMVREIDDLGYSSVSLDSFGCTCSENRNLLIEMAKEYKARYILLCDNDMYFFPGTFTKLIKANKDIISGISVYKNPPYTVAAYNLDENGVYKTIKDWEEGSTFKVDGVGGAFLLIKMEVFEKIEKPYFSVGKRKKVHISNDFYFCYQAEKAGIDIWVDSSAKTGHLGVYPFTIDNYLANKEVQDE